MVSGPGVLVFPTVGGCEKVGLKSMIAVSSGWVQLNQMFRDSGYCVGRWAP